MAESAKLSFSREHTSKSNPEPHTDSYRQVSNSSHVEKTGHNPCPETRVEINRSSSDDSGDSGK